MQDSTKTSKNRTILSGSCASQGYAIGVVRFLNSTHAKVTKRKIRQDRIPYELSRFHSSIAQTLKELRILKDEVTQNIGPKEARIFDTHIMILQDPTLVDAVEGLIQTEHFNSEYAFQNQIHLLLKGFEQQTSEMAREKIHDLKDISHRVLSHLTETELGLEIPDLDKPAVLVTHSLTPSVVSQLDPHLTLGFATDTGGLTSHVSIIARSMQIPGVSGLSQISLLAKDEDPIIIDGHSGLIILHPSEEDYEIYTNRIEREKKRKYYLRSLRQKPPITKDGKYLCLKANIELPAEAASVIHNGAEGIGLFRSEFLYFQNELPTEEEQFQHYKTLLQSMQNRPVTIRTLDTGGDKLVKSLSMSGENNPFLGWRSIRVCLDMPDIFKEQLRALLRASVHGNLRIMFPMITSIEELLTAKAILNEVKEQLTLEDVPFDPNLAVGMMVEVPAVVMLIEDFAREVDFFSIGSNDLIQFTLAVDRTNERIASLYNSHHPAILKMVQQVCKAAHARGISVSVCGEMATDPISILLLAGLGVDELSMSPWNITETKELIRSLTFENLRLSALHCLECSSSQQIDSYLYNKYGALTLKINANTPMMNSKIDEFLIDYKGYQIKVPRYR